MPSTGVDVGTYRYDNQGRLRAEWDPRIAPALKTTYDYNADGLLSRVTPPGEHPWSLTCRAATGEPASTGRLRMIARTGPSGTATRTVVYDVALSGTGAPYAMDASSVGQWAQTDQRGAPARRRGPPHHTRAQDKLRRRHLGPADQGHPTRRAALEAHLPDDRSDPAAGRLKTATRVGPTGTATWTAVYDVPLSGTGAPYTVGASDVAKWA
jgi:YD repeat-containing protein